MPLSYQLWHFLALIDHQKRIPRRSVAHVQHLVTPLSYYMVTPLQKYWGYADRTNRHGWTSVTGTLSSAESWDKVKMKSASIEVETINKITFDFIHEFCCHPWRITSWINKTLRNDNRTLSFRHVLLYNSNTIITTTAVSSLQLSFRIGTIKVTPILT